MPTSFYPIATVVLFLSTAWFLLASIVKTVQWLFRMAPPSDSKWRLGPGGAIVACFGSWLLLTVVTGLERSQFDFHPSNLQSEDFVGTWKTEGSVLVLHADGRATGEGLPLRQEHTVPLQWRLDRNALCIDEANTGKTLARWPVYYFRGELRIHADPEPLVVADGPLPRRLGYKKEVQPHSEVDP